MNSGLNKTKLPLRLLLAEQHLSQSEASPQQAVVLGVGAGPRCAAGSQGVM